MAGKPHTQAVRTLILWQGYKAVPGPTPRLSGRASETGYKAGDPTTTWPPAAPRPNVREEKARTFDRASYAGDASTSRVRCVRYSAGVTTGFAFGVRFATGFAFCGLRARKYFSVAAVCFASSVHVEPFALAGRLYVLRRYARTTLPEIPSVSAISSGRVIDFAIVFTSPVAFEVTRAERRTFEASRVTSDWRAARTRAMVVTDSAEGFAFAFTREAYHAQRTLSTLGVRNDRTHQSLIRSTIGRDNHPPSRPPALGVDAHGAAARRAQRAGGEIFCGQRDDLRIHPHEGGCMPRARKGPKGPKKGAAGKKGTNRKTPRGGAGVSGMAHEKHMTTKRTGY